MQPPLYYVILVTLTKRRGSKYGPISILKTGFFLTFRTLSRHKLSAISMTRCTAPLRSPVNGPLGRQRLFDESPFSGLWVGKGGVRERVSGTIKEIKKSHDEKNKMISEMLTDQHNRVSTDFTAQNFRTF